MDSLCNSSVSLPLPPTSVVLLQVSLSLSLTDYVSLSLKAHYSVSPPLSLFTTHTHLPSSFFVFQQTVFSSLLLELQLDAFLFSSPSL